LRGGRDADQFQHLDRLASRLGRLQSVLVQATVSPIWSPTV
jgi:hypothetical protein